MPTCTQRPTGVNLQGENFLLRSVGGLNLTGKFGTGTDTREEETEEDAATRKTILERRQLRPSTWKAEAIVHPHSKSGPELLDVRRW